MKNNLKTNKMTTVEWLEERFEKFLAYYEGHHKAEMYSIHQLSNDFDQAKEIENQQKDDFAIEFLNWLDTQDSKELILDLQMFGELPKQPTNKQLLEVFKNKNSYGFN